MLEAYSRWPNFSRDAFIEVIANLANPASVGQEPVISVLEKGLRSCSSQENINLLRQKLKRLLMIDFGEAERIALKYLPSGTPIESVVHLTIDTFNTAMVSRGDIGLSILSIDPDNFNFPILAHELHHSGFQYWLEQNPRMKNKLSKGDSNHDQIAASMILSLLSEGLASYFCTPSMVSSPSEHGEKHDKKIKNYESNLNKMWGEFHSLLSDCASKSAPLEECRNRFNDIRFDLECIVPQIHFIGATMIGMFDKDLAISTESIVNLCKEPADFFKFYSQICSKYGMPAFAHEVVERISALL